ncbi:hypothetical protein F2Q69_00036215 [Brassica cretica]|uniref:Uncharacterized protein n=1 Tax=Brassica cretica TaxID=69181 RepID=A0A8S9SQI2_BRACR|nr:hypothetical protein F2Q69_00036215 [Brassica cretica]
MWGESDCLNVRRSDGNRSRGVRRDRIKQNKPTLRQRMTALTKHTVCLCLLVWMQIRTRPERMAKSNRNTRRTVNETAEGGWCCCWSSCCSGWIGSRFGYFGTSLARLPAAAAPPVAPPVVEEVENVAPDGEEAHVVRNPSYLKWDGMTALTKHTVCLCLLVWMQIRTRPERMAKSNCNTRRTMNVTTEGSASNVARNEAGMEKARNAAQNAANLNNAAAAGAAAGAAAAPVGLEAVLAILAQVLARLPAAAAPDSGSTCCGGSGEHGA